MPDIYDAFFHRDDSRFIVILNADVKCRAAYGNYRRGGKNPIVIGLSAPLLDVDFHPSDQNIQQIAPVSGILSKDNIGVRIDFKVASIGNLEVRIAVWTGDNDLPRLHLIADIERPGW